MPVRVVCRECGYVLAEYEGLPDKPCCKLDPTWIEKLHKKYGNRYTNWKGVCPRCGHKLADEPVDVEVKKAE